MTTLAGKKLVHVTTVDMSLVLLLGPQLRAFSEAGMEVVGVSAPGPFVPELESWGIRHEPLLHATRSAAVGQDLLALRELWQLFQRLEPDIVHTHNPKPGVYGRVAARAAGVAQYWTEHLGLEPGRISIGGYGHYQPVTAKTGEWQKSKNRRIEIIILRSSEGFALPSPAPASSGHPAAQTGS